MNVSSEVADIDARRSSLLQGLALLDREREHILARDAPIRRLVDDMLAYIFELSAAEDIFFPETASCVSVKWRAVILRTPPAWANLVLDRRHFPPPELRTFMRRCEVFLGRSQSAPLTVKLDLLPMPFDTDVAQLMNTLHPHLHRCAVLHLVVDANWLSIIASSLSTLGPSLRDLDIRTLHANSTPISLTFTDINGAVPRLQHLVLNNIPPSSLPIIQYPSLKSLELWGLQWPFPGNDGAHEWPWTSTAELLQMTPNLERLTLCRMEFTLENDELLTPRKIELKCLNYLAFECMETRSVAIVFESLVAPHLRSLKLKYDPSRICDHWCMHRLETTCLSGLEQLEVEGYSIHGANLSWFLRTLALTPNLTHLTIASPPLLLDPRFFDHMSTGPNWLVPKLRDLTLIACASLVSQDLLRLIRSRAVQLTREPLFPIRTLSLKMSPWNVLDEDSLNLLRMHVETLNHSTTDTHIGNRFLQPHSPVFRVVTPPAMFEPVPVAAPAAVGWDVAPRLGTPFGDDRGPVIPALARPRGSMVASGRPVSTAASPITNRRQLSPSSFFTHALPNVSTMLLVASASALATSFVCMHIFSHRP